MPTPSSETYTLTGPGLEPLPLHDGFGAAVSRALTAAQHPRTTDPGEYLLHGENGRLVARVVRDGNGHARVWASDRGIGDGDAAHSPRSSSTRRPDPPAATEGGTVPQKSSTKKRSGGKRGNTAKRSSTARRSSPAAAMSHVSAKDAVRDVLQKAGKPLPTAEIVSGVLATEGVVLKGKTPAATIAAILSVENGKEAGMFVRVEKGTYDLRERQGGASA